MIKIQVKTLTVDTSMFRRVNNLTTIQESVQSTTKMITYLALIYVLLQGNKVYNIYL